MITTFRLGHNKVCHTANIYSPNNHNNAKTFFNTFFKEWDEYLITNLHKINPDDTVYSIVAGDLNCVIRESDAQNRNRTIFLTS